MIIKPKRIEWMRNIYSILFAFEDNRQNYGEQRLVTMGMLGMKVIVINYAELLNITTYIIGRFGRYY